MRKLIIAFSMLTIFVSCAVSKKDCVTVKSLESLTIYYPEFDRINLEFGKLPSKENDQIIFCAAASFTGACLDNFMHSNIASDHVSSGIRYEGYECKRNNGAFVYYKGQWEFVEFPYNEELDQAAKNGGMAFCQEMFISNGKEIPHTRPNTNRNRFRALCDLGGKLCIIDTKEIVPFGDFITMLLSEGVTSALYMDMGCPWNHSWYRNSDGLHIIYPYREPYYCTNWIVFYKK